MRWGYYCSAKQRGKRAGWGRTPIGVKQSIITRIRPQGAGSREHTYFGDTPNNQDISAFRNYTQAAAINRTSKMCQATANIPPAGYDTAVVQQYIHRLLYHWFYYSYVLHLAQKACRTWYATAACTRNILMCREEKPWGPTNMQQSRHLRQLLILRTHRETATRARRHSYRPRGRRVA